MIAGNLDTTNLLLGIIAAVSLLEGLVIIALAFMAYKGYAAVMKTVRGIEERQIAPLAARVDSLMTTVDGVLADVRGITSRVGTQTERVDQAIQSTIDRVDETADRVRVSMGSRIRQVLAVAHGIRAAMGSFSNGHARHAAERLH